MCQYMLWIPNSSKKENRTQDPAYSCNFSVNRYRKRMLDQHLSISFPHATGSKLTGQLNLRSSPLLLYGYYMHKVLRIQIFKILDSPAVSSSIQQEDYVKFYKVLYYVLNKMTEVCVSALGTQIKIIGSCSKFNVLKHLFSQYTS